MNTLVIITFHTIGKNYNKSYLEEYGKYTVVGGIERKVENYIKLFNGTWKVAVLLYKSNTWWLTYDQIQFTEVSLFECLNDINPVFILISDEEVSVHLKHHGFFDKIRDIYTTFLMSQYYYPELDKDNYRGILSNGPPVNKDGVFHVGAFYDSNVFYNKKIDRKNFAIYAGRIDPNKDLHMLVIRWRKIYEKFGTKLYLIGGTNDPEYFQMLSPYIDGKIIDHIFWLPTEKLIDYYDTCRLIVNPSRRESLCWTLIESLACGCTCIVDGYYSGLPSEFHSYVIGRMNHWSNKLEEFIYDALDKEIVKDGSDYIKKYSIENRKEDILSFIERRL